jgi:hypothetical protein
LEPAAAAFFLVLVVFPGGDSAFVSGALDVDESLTLVWDAEPAGGSVFFDPVSDAEFELD